MKRRSKGAAPQPQDEPCTRHAHESGWTTTTASFVPRPHLTEPWLGSVTDSSWGCSLGPKFSERQLYLHIDRDLANEVHVIPVDQPAVCVAQDGGVERRDVLHVRLASQLRQVVVVALAQDLTLPVPCSASKLSDDLLSTSQHTSTPQHTKLHCGSRIPRALTVLSQSILYVGTR